MFRQQGNPLKNIVSGCVVRSEHRIDILNGKSIGKEQLNVFITQPFIEKMVSFWESVKKFKMSRQRWSMQAFRPVTLLKETPTQVFSCECCEIFRSAFFTEHL